MSAKCPGKFENSTVCLLCDAFHITITYPLTESCGAAGICHHPACIERRAIR